MKQLFLIGLIFAVLLSCRPKPIDIKVDSAEPKLVAFTHIVPDNIMLVALSKSFSALDGNTTDDLSELLISGATVKIIFDNQTFDFYELSPGIYASFSNAYQVNEEYELVAWYGTDTIRSKARMLPQANFSSITPIVEKNPGDTNVYIDFTFNDFQNDDNWYLINFYKKQATDQGTDLVNYFSNGNNTLTKSIIVSDKEFNGTYHKKEAVSDFYHKDSVVVTLSNISESYYNYLNYRIGGGNIFNQLNIEPVNYPTNIVNGYGFFNTHFPDIHFFDLGQF